MPLTLQQAQQAGQIAGQVALLNKAVSDLSAAVGAGAIIEQMSASTNISALSLSIPMSVQDSATILNAVLQVMNGGLITLTAQLATLG